MRRKDPEAGKPIAARIPAVLLDPHAPEWRSLSLANVWCERHGLPGLKEHSGSQYRHVHREVVGLWALAYGLVKQTRLGDRPDWKALDAVIRYDPPDPRPILKNT